MRTQSLDHIVVNGSVHAACKQHQRVCKFACKCVYVSCVNGPLGLSLQSSAGLGGGSFLAASQSTKAPCTQDATREAKQIRMRKTPLWQQKCSHCRQQATHQATSIRMGPGSIFFVPGGALLLVWMRPKVLLSVEATRPRSGVGRGLEGP